MSSDDLRCSARADGRKPEQPAEHEEVTAKAAVHADRVTEKWVGVDAVMVRVVEPVGSARDGGLFPPLLVPQKPAFVAPRAERHEVVDLALGGLLGVDSVAMDGAVV